MGYLQSRLQQVADLAGKPDRIEEFTERYSELLGEITGALKLMRGLAQMQGGWLQAQASALARMN